MSDSFLSLYGREEGSDLKEGPLPALPTRSDVLTALSGSPHFDLLIVGGGLSGVTIARDAALQGSDVLLIEPGYFGDRSVSWREYLSDALAKDPVRLLKTVRGLHRVLKDVAPHLATTWAWRDETPRGWVGRWIASLVRRAWSPDSECPASSVIPDVDEIRLVREMALAARQEGALLLGAASTTYVERDEDVGGFRMGAKDLHSGTSMEVTASALYIDPTYTHPIANRVGIPLIRREVPKTPDACVTCVVEIGVELTDTLPQFESVALGDGTLGGISHLAPGVVEVSVAAPDPRDHRAITQRVQQVCKARGYVVREELGSRSCGRIFDTRTRVVHADGVILSAERSPWEIFSISPKILSRVSARGPARSIQRPLPGEWRADERARFIDLARAARISDQTINRVLNRWRGRVRYLSVLENGFREICPGVLQGEISLAVLSDQVCSSEDLIFGSLNLQTMMGWREYTATITRVLEETVASLKA